jgi:hypothetical protein
MVWRWTYLFWRSGIKLFVVSDPSVQQVADLAQAPLSTLFSEEAFVHRPSIAFPCGNVANTQLSPNLPEREVY